MVKGLNSKLEGVGPVVSLWVVSLLRLHLLTFANLGVVVEMGLRARFAGLISFTLPNQCKSILMNRLSTDPCISRLDVMRRSLGSWIAPEPLVIFFLILCAILALDVQQFSFPCQFDPSLRERAGIFI